MVLIQWVLRNISRFEIRRNSVIKTLERNYWAYRWEKVLDLTGLKSTPELEARKKKLKRLAKMANAGRHPIPLTTANII